MSLRLTNCFLVPGLSSQITHEQSRSALRLIASAWELVTRMAQFAGRVAGQLIQLVRSLLAELRAQETMSFALESFQSQQVDLMI